MVFASSTVFGMSLNSPPWEPAKARKPARTPLTQERIVDAALELLVAEGYDALSMRRIAQALGTGAASLYAHVANKQELDQLMINRVAQGLVIPDPDPERWKEQLAQVMRDLLRVMRSYPGVARVAIGQIPLGEESLVSTERMLAILRAGGLPDDVAAYAVDLIPLYVCSVAFEESVQGSSSWTQADIDEFTTNLGKWFAGLPNDRFPHIVALAGALTAGGPDERFDFGVQVIVAGLASFAKRDREA
jgi:AcrR family transcriptional regulator